MSPKRRNRCIVKIDRWVNSLINFGKRAAVRKGLPSRIGWMLNGNFG